MRHGSAWMNSGREATASVPLRMRRGCRTACGGQFLGIGGNATDASDRKHQEREERQATKQPRGIGSQHGHTPLAGKHGAAVMRPPLRNARPPEARRRAARFKIAKPPGGGRTRDRPDHFTINCAGKTSKPQKRETLGEASGHTGEASSTRRRKAAAPPDRASTPCAGTAGSAPSSLEPSPSPSKKYQHVKQNAVAGLRVLR